MEEALLSAVKLEVYLPAEPVRLTPEQIGFLRKVRVPTHHSLPFPLPPFPHPPLWIQPQVTVCTLQARRRKTAFQGEPINAYLVVAIPAGIPISPIFTPLPPPFRLPSSSFSSSSSFLPIASHHLCSLPPPPLSLQTNQCEAGLSENSRTFTGTSSSLSKYAPLLPSPPLLTHLVASLTPLRHADPSGGPRRAAAQGGLCLIRFLLRHHLQAHEGRVQCRRRGMGGSEVLG